MKKLLFLFVMSLFTTLSFAQSNSIENFNMEHRVAIKTNPAKYFLLNFDLGVEYFLNQKTSVDFSVNVAEAFSTIDISGNRKNSYKGLYYGGVARYKMWYRGKNDKTNRNLFNGFYMAPGIVFGTSQKEGFGLDLQQFEQFTLTTDTNKFIGGIYDFGMHAKVKRMFLEAFIGVGYVYNTDVTLLTSAGAIILNQSMIGRFGFRLGYTL